MIRAFPLFTLTASLLVLTPVDAAAQEAARTADPQNVPLVQPVDAEAEAQASPFAVEAMDDAALRGIAGREDTTQISQAEQVAGVSRNSVGENSVTGEARIDGNAFQNMSGLSILNVNTGNNVAINAAMNVNISINPGQ
jgi:hypothetical protein